MSRTSQSPAVATRADRPWARFRNIIPGDALLRVSRQSPARTVSDGITLARRLAARSLPRTRIDRFGLNEALYFGGRLDQWQRYSSVLTAVQRSCDTSRRMRVLDAGAGGPGILAWAPYASWISRAELVLLDIREDLPRGFVHAVRATGTAMPFADRSFDLAVCIDSIEHVPNALQASYASELMRVAEVVVAHFPATTADGRFMGRAGDSDFQRWFRARYGRDEPNTAEHLATEGHPDPALLFAGATIEGSQPAREWGLTMRRDHSMWARHVSGFRFWRRRMRPRQAGPFHAALVTWRRPADREEPPIGVDDPGG